MPLSTVSSTDLTKSGLWTRSRDAIWELVRNASSQAPSQTYWVRNFGGGLSKVQGVLLKLHGVSEGFVKAQITWSTPPALLTSSRPSSFVSLAQS